jgi:hypothetical protein
MENIPMYEILDQCSRRLRKTVNVLLGGKVDKRQCPVYPNLNDWLADFDNAGMQFCFLGQFDVARFKENTILNFVHFEWPERTSYPLQDTNRLLTAIFAVLVSNPLQDSPITKSPL